MKRKIFSILAILVLVGFSQSEADITYSFDVTVDYSGITDDWDKIQGIEFTISGTENTDWEFDDAFNSPYNGDAWFFDKTGIIDDTFNFSDINTSVPLNSGPIFTLVSPNDSVITITNIVPFDYNDLDFDTDKFSAQLNVVPIPGAIWLLGSALVGLIGIRSRRLKRS